MFSIIILGEEGLFSLNLISCPLISISVMAAQFFSSLSTSVFPLTVISRYLVVESSGNVYLSDEVVLPLLIPSYTFEKVLPSFDTDITKLYCRSLPLYQAISTLQMVFCAPKSILIQEPTPSCDHRVPRLLSLTFGGMASSPSSPIAVIPEIARFWLHELMSVAAT